VLQCNNSVNYLVKGDNFSKQVVHIIHTQLYYKQINTNTNNTRHMDMSK
jgi:hypothetical protein